MLSISSFINKFLSFFSLYHILRQVTPGPSLRNISDIINANGNELQKTNSVEDLKELQQQPEDTATQGKETKKEKKFVSFYHFVFLKVNSMRLERQYKP